jgi:hypothetical protein
LTRIPDDIELTRPPGGDAPIEVRRAWKAEQRARAQHAGYKRSIRRESVGAPTHINTLPEFELDCLRAYLERACSTQRRMAGTDVTTAAALAALLTTGRSLETLTNLRASTIGSRTSIFEVPAGLVIKEGHWGWWLPAGPIEGERHLGAQEESFHHATTKMAWLPCGKLMRKLVIRMLEERGIAIHRNGSHQLFARSPEDLDRQLRENLRSLRRQSRSQTTLGRVKRWLYDAVFIQTAHDHSVAVLISGRTSPFDRAGRSYVNLPARTVARLYGQAVARVDAENNLWVPPELEPLSIGSPYRPLGDKLQRFAGAQLEVLRDRGPGRRIDIVRIHDAITRYTIVMVALALGVRHLRALPSSTRIDRATGFVAISDKRENRPELPSGYRQRLLWVCEEAQEQIRLYEAHLKAVEHRLQVALPATGRDGALPVFALSSVGGGAFVAESLPPLTLMLELTYHGLRVRRNAWRHFLRSHLVGECSGEVIRAFMGHWEQGMEPWAGDSALDPLAYRRSLSQAIPRFLRSLGFQPMPGLN